LTALYPTDKRSGSSIKWHCRCDCGNECDIDMGNLRAGKSQSCGCTQSKQEENIIKLLTQNNISFNYQYRFANFKIKEFDFYIDNKYIIEFDGQQHFKYTGTGWNTQENFERTRKSDLIKNKFCFDNNISIIRIPYDANYTLDDLKLETTRFLLTPENEEEYYKSRAK
jgi:very-short-patch-repair endonuclease